MGIPTAIPIRVFQRRALRTVGLVTLLVCFILTIAWGTKRNLLTLSATTGQGFSELYFTAPQDLPTKVIAGQTKTVSFTVANHENHDITYPYQVSIIQGGNERIIAVNKVAVKGRTSRSQDVEYMVSEPGKPATLIVSLSNKKQLITFQVQAL